MIVEVFGLAFLFRDGLLMLPGFSGAAAAAELGWPRLAARGTPEAMRAAFPSGSKRRIVRTGPSREPPAGREGVRARRSAWAGRDSAWAG
jgi:hypothetical protein